MIASTKRQRQLIGIACGQLGIDKAIKADMLRERFGEESTCDINAAQADAFLSELKGKGFRIKRSGKGETSGKVSGGPRRQGNMVRMASRAQHEKIAAVARLIDWRVKDGLTRWLFKRYSIHRVKTSQEAFLAIEGLKKMFEHQMEKEHGKQWMTRVWDDPEVSRYIREHIS